MRYRVCAVAAVLVGLPCFAVAADEAATEQGKALFEARCGGLCHQLPEPGMLRAAQWARVLQTMQLRMKQVGMPPLSEEELANVSLYLSAHAKP